MKRYHDSSFRHQLVDEKDYIAEPRNSGYRSHHLIYKYYSDKKDTYNGLKIEVQIRSRLQHCWATAVETVGTFLQQSLKSSEGEDDWLRFFALMSNEIAMREKSPLVPGTPTDPRELKEEIQHYADDLDVASRLQGYSLALRISVRPGLKGSRYFLMEQDEKEIRVTGYKTWQLDLATEAYYAAEQQASKVGGDAVLVSVDSVKALRNAFPNYYRDTSRFLLELRLALR